MLEELPDTECRAPERDRRRSLAGLLDYVPRSAVRVLDCTGTLGGSRGRLLKGCGASEVMGLVDAAAGMPGEGEGYDDAVTGALDFVTLPFAEGYFDCILCTEILERLRNPDAFLPAVLHCLAPGGLFLASVPNIQYHKIVCALAEGRWVYGDSGVWSRDNLRFFTAREIRLLLQRSGLANCKLAGLVGDEAVDWPLDSAGYARCGRLRIGPLDESAHQTWLTEYYLVAAVKPAS